MHSYHNISFRYSIFWPPPSYLSSWKQNFPTDPITFSLSSLTPFNILTSLLIQLRFHSLYLQTLLCICPRFPSLSLCHWHRSQDLNPIRLNLVFEHLITVVYIYYLIWVLQHTWENKWENRSLENLSKSFRITQLISGMCVCAQACLTLCHSMDCSPPSSSVHRIF